MLEILEIIVLLLVLPGEVVNVCRLDCDHLLFFYLS